MPSTPSTLSVAGSSVTSSKSSATPPVWHEHVLRKKYRDLLKLKLTLDNLYGENQYKIKVYIISPSVPFLLMRNALTTIIYLDQKRPMDCSSPKTHG
jgi:hypothetical protein